MKLPGLTRCFKFSKFWVYEKRFLFKEISYIFIFLQFHNPSKETDTLKTHV